MVRQLKAKKIEKIQKTPEMVGKALMVNDLVNVFKASEGSINMYYGKIGNGKTYAATSDILDLLKQGKVVYANWHIIVEDFDDRNSLLLSVANFMLSGNVFIGYHAKKTCIILTQSNLIPLQKWLSG